jgi:hypothetical protein
MINGSGSIDGLGAALAHYKQCAKNEDAASLLRRIDIDWRSGALKELARADLVDLFRAFRPSEEVIKSIGARSYGDGASSVAWQPQSAVRSLQQSQILMNKLKPIIDLLTKAQDSGLNPVRERAIQGHANAFSGRAAHLVRETVNMLIAEGTIPKSRDEAASAGLDRDLTLQGRPYITHQFYTMLGLS